MKKFCICIPLVESGIVAAVNGLVIWISQFLKFVSQISVETHSGSFTVLLAISISGIIFELLLIYAYVKVNRALINIWRIYQIVLISLLFVASYYDVSNVFFMLMDLLSIIIELYFIFVIRAFQKHLDLTNEPVEYHPMNEIDDEAYINDYY